MLDYFEIKFLQHNSPSVCKKKCITFYTKNIAERKFNQEIVLPLIEDIVRVREHILKKTQQSMKQLEQFPETETWRKLAYLVLCRVSIFNKIRGGEVEAMLLEFYSNTCVDESKGWKELVSSLQPIEQKLMVR